MTLIMTGVASTAIRPDPTKGAVCSGPTTISAVPVSPGTIWPRTVLALLFDDVMPPYSAKLSDRGVAFDATVLQYQPESRRGR